MDMNVGSVPQELAHRVPDGGAVEELWAEHGWSLSGPQTGVIVGAIAVLSALLRGVGG